MQQISIAYKQLVLADLQILAKSHLQLHFFFFREISHKIFNLQISQLYASSSSLLYCTHM